MTKSVSRAAAQKKRNANPKTASKSTAKVGNRHRKPAAKVAAEMVRETHRKTTALIEQFPGTQVPDTFRVLAESNVAQTREVYEHSKKTLQSVLESWRNSLGTAGQGVTALNHKIIELAERNIDMSFDLAMNLCKSKNLAEVVELQTAYWQKQFGELKTLTDEVRRRSATTRTGIPRRT